MSLTVLSVAYPLAAVGSDAAGGAEQVLTMLEAGLVRRRDRSIVVACEGSETAGRLVATPRLHGLLDDAARRNAWRGHRQAIERVLSRERVDLVHMHGVDFSEYLPTPGVPVLATLHLPPSFYAPHALAPSRPQTHLSCVSETQRRACPATAVVSAVITNGVDVERFAVASRRGDFVAALGRICPEKGLHLALAAARRAGLECRLAGELYPYAAHLRYYRSEIRPRLDRQRRYLGPLGFQAKRRLLAEARCLLVPSLVDETSSLVAMEALAAGTPVIAFARGALVEIVEHGTTGYLVADVAEMADAIAAAHLIEPDACRRAARVRFSADAMIERHRALYARLAAGGGVSAPAAVEARE